MAAYEETEYRTYKVTDEQERVLLANFTARIKAETRIVDGVTTETILTLSGTAANPDNKHRPIQLPDVEVPAQSFAGMGWVMGAWGVAAVIQPGHGTKDDLRACIQINSRPERKTIFRTLGWQHIGAERAFLHAKGAITRKGNDNTVSVRLPPELSKYDLTPHTPYKQKEAFLASLALTTIGPRKLTWTLWTATFAPIFGPVDFAVHVTGRSGTFKSELASLFQSHFGPEMDARHLPGSWSSTPNALEAQAYYAGNAVYCIDDFVPTGTSWQIRAYQTGADKLIRGQGNQAGRARLTDTSGMQTTYYPRGIIMSTGEDTPEGHSVRARMMISEMTPGDIDIRGLTTAQKKRPLYVLCMADMIEKLCREEIPLEKRSHRIRDENIKIGHTRTPSMIGRLIATGEVVLELAATSGYIDAKMAADLKKEMSEAIIENAKDQCKYLESADPVEIFLQGFRQALAAGHCHVRTLSGGIPMHCVTLGWTSEKSSSSIESFKSHGPCVGWIDWEEDEIFIDADNGFAIVKKVVGPEMSLTKQTVWKRMKDAGLLCRTDDTRQRNTIRVQCEGHQRTVVVMAATTTLDQAEKPGTIPR